MYHLMSIYPWFSSYPSDTPPAPPLWLLCPPSPGHTPRPLPVRGRKGSEL